MADPRDGGEAERLARQGAERAGGAGAVRDLLRRERVAVLSTVSLRHPGVPAGSLVPFALDGRGAPLLLLSALAQHTRNLEADPRGSLLVFDAEAAARDPRTAPRATLVGRFERVPDAEAAEACERYVARHPGAGGLLRLDFAPWRLALEEAQLVGGFGAAGWFAGSEIVGG